MIASRALALKEALQREGGREGEREGGRDRGREPLQCYIVYWFIGHVVPLEW